MLFSWSIFIVILSCSVQCWSYTLFTNSTQAGAGYLHRVIRQASNCKASERQCKSGECLSKHVFCDGAVDCADGSDETVSSCANIPCPSSLYFQCAYGACVSGDAKCDKNKDCADNSDETLPECGYTGQTVPVINCGNKKFACDDQTCISKYEVCDGEKNCPDGSDETFAQCKKDNSTCWRDYFQCTYGACVDGDAPCNGKIECADGSDESEVLCKSVQQPGDGEVKTGCKLPPLPNNGYYTVNRNSNFIPGTITSGITVLDFYCYPDYKLDKTADVTCSPNNKWNREFPECLRTCPPRTSSTVDIKCSRNGAPVDCTKPVLHGTIADISCKQFYHFPPYNTIPSPSNHLICEDGSWDLSLSTCLPVCGKKNAKGIPNIVGGSNTMVGEYPWHVGVYLKRTVQNRVAYTQVCGGSIVTTTAVISAAHCFENRDPKNYAVAAGKYYRSWNDARDSLAQPRQVAKLFIPDHYKGLSHNYANDIALMIVDKPFEFSNVVSPVCVDWSGTTTERKLLLNKATGYVAGWGLVEELGDNSIELKHIQLQYVPYERCYNKSVEDFRPIVGLVDKFCAGREDGQNVCEGDSGGGLTFQLEELFYLMGIVSIGPRSKTGSCDPSQYTTFTKFSHHAQWADNITSLNRIFT
ncbi:modular serine protease-like [Chrysoperla carnea]|uniref:modular serine protease-like n=1 Tax=Chrysoperla carnea TaxID=189513 RepID=UPI001D08FFD0|nr:modular serine protease-like [Chrysoperla carnea]